MALTKPKTSQIEVHPDAKKHQYISFIKSGLRIVGCYFLAYYDLQLAAGLFLLAEFLGIAEELV